MSRRRLVSIVVPVYNEAGNVVPLYEAVKRVLAPLEDRYEYELVFTDNHSEDSTFEEIAALAALDRRVRVFRFSRNFGFQRSIYTGYMRARGDAVVQIDCDLQDPPELIVDFIREWEAGFHMVYGVRRSRREGLLITTVRKFFYRLIDRLSEDRLPHDAGDFRLIDRRIIEVLRGIEDYKPYLRGTLATLGFAQKGIPYDRRSRERGASKFSFRALLALALDGILSHSTVPLRLATYTGLTVSVITFLAISVYFVGRVLIGMAWPPGFATTTILLLLSISLNAVFLGVIGEYVGRIYQQVRRRPLTVVERQIDSYDSRMRVDAAGALATLGAPQLSGQPLDQLDAGGDEKIT